MKRSIRFDRNAWLLMALVLFFLLVDVAQIVYRFSLPTDGWLIDEEGTSSLVPVYKANQVGALSGLQPGDIIRAVGGKPFEITNIVDSMAIPSGWQVGKTVMVAVERGSQTVTVPVPLVHWTLPAFWRYNTRDPGLIVGDLGALFILLLAWSIFYLRPEVTSARIILVLGSITFALNIDSFLPVGFADFFNQAAFIFSNFYNFVIWTALLPSSILMFALFFPQPKQAIRRHHWLGFIPAAIGLVTLVSLYTSSSLVAVNQLSSIEPACLFVAAIAALIHSYFTQRDATSQAQLRWAIWGFVIALGLSLVNVIYYTPSKSVVAEILFLVSNLSTVVIGLCLSIAVLRFHLFEIDVIIRKTLVYVLLTGLLALVYLGCVLLLDNLIAALSGQQHSAVALVLSTLAIASLFNPLRRRIQTIIDRRFFRRKYNAEQALESFSVSIRDQVDLDSMTQTLLGAVRDTLQPDQLGLWLLPAKSDTRRIAEPGREKIHKAGGEPARAGDD
jgi:hypothetical protein